MMDPDSPSATPLLPPRVSVSSVPCAVRAGVSYGRFPSVSASPACAMSLHSLSMFDLLFLGDGFAALSVEPDVLQPHAERKSLPHEERVSLARPGEKQLPGPRQ